MSIALAGIITFVALVAFMVAVARITLRSTKPEDRPSHKFWWVPKRRKPQ